MEKFLKNYIKTFVKCNDENLTKKDIKKIVCQLQEDDYLWNTLDSCIDSYIAELKTEKGV